MTTSTTNQLGRGALAATAVMAAASGSSAASQDQFLADVKSGDPQKQFTAWKSAKKQEPGIIIPLGELLDSDTMSVVKCASQSILEIVHSVGKKTDDPRRKAVTNYLLELLNKDSVNIQTAAFRALSLIADSDSVVYIAPFLTNKELQEEAVFCLERIPGPVSAKALIDGLKRVQDDFKPRVMAALGHRKVEDAVWVIEQYMQDSNLDLAMAAVKAIARIGVMPETDPPDMDSLSPRQRKIMLDSVLRFCDKQIAKGETDFPANFLPGILMEDGLEEHFYCGAIISASKLNDPEVVSAIIKQLNRPLYIVRDTAVKNLVAMKGGNVDSALQEALTGAEGDAKKAIQDILKKRNA